MPRIAFTALKLKTLPTPPRTAAGTVAQVDYWDETEPGFGLRVSSSGARTWVLMSRVMRAGRPVQVRSNVGRAGDPKDDPGALTLADARAKARGMLQAIAAGQDPLAVKRQEHEQRIEESKKTFGAVRDVFMAKHCEKRRASTYRQYESILKGEDVAPWTDRPLNSITRRDVRELLERVLERGVTVRANRVLASVRKFFNWAVEHDYLQLAPTVGVKAPVQERPRERHLFGDTQKNRPSEIALAWRAFEQCGPVDGAYLRLLMLNGQRRDEVAHIRDDELFDLDGEQPRWIIPGEKTKNGEEHAVPLTALQVELLRSVPRFAGCPYIFTTNGKSPINGFSKLKIKADAAIARLKETGGYEGQFVEPWTLHDLRRTFSTGLIELGAGESLVDLLTNHKSGEGKRGVRKHYNHARRERDKREAMLLWERHIRSLLEPAPAKVLQLAA